MNLKQAYLLGRTDERHDQYRLMELQAIADGRLETIQRLENVVNKKNNQLASLKSRLGQIWFAIADRRDYFKAANELREVVNSI